MDAKATDKPKRVINRTPQVKAPVTKESLEAKKRDIEKQIKLLQLEMQKIDIELEFLVEASAVNGTV